MQVEEVELVIQTEGEGFAKIQKLQFFSFLKKLHFRFKFWTPQIIALFSRHILPYCSIILN